VEAVSSSSVSWPSPADPERSKTTTPGRPTLAMASAFSRSVRIVPILSCTTAMAWMFSCMPPENLRQANQPPAMTTTNRTARAPRIHFHTPLPDDCWSVMGSLLTDEGEMDPEG